MIICADHHKDENPKVLTKLLSSCWIEVGDTVSAMYFSSHLMYTLYEILKSGTCLS